MTRYWYWVVASLDRSTLALELGFDDPITTAEQLNEIAIHVKKHFNIEFGSCVVTNFIFLRTEVVKDGGQPS